MRRPLDTLLRGLTRLLLGASVFVAGAFACGYLVEDVLLNPDVTGYTGMSFLVDNLVALAAVCVVASLGLTIAVDRAWVALRDRAAPPPA